MIKQNSSYIAHYICYQKWGRKHRKVKGTFAPVLKHQVTGAHVRDLEVQVQHITHLDTMLNSY